eukprot:TRINITY_DN2508_c0_g1_i1.p2 TRINITY_DN2508_c0_g1~~TRINITY_DN2508_c0_g1_i1.p2  ORF type:complete len:109 (-),score=29.51 TRINITY_DN2508_c0_g1_i1:177-503(-)
MMRTTLVLLTLSMLSSSTWAFTVKKVQGDIPDSPCDQQCRFDIRMCKSFMCNKCTYEWCTETCQKIQAANPGLRCADWPESRTSFSNGEFMGKGKLGDGGDFAQKQDE